MFGFLFAGANAEIIWITWRHASFVTAGDFKSKNVTWFCGLGVNSRCRMRIQLLISNPWCITKLMFQKSGSCWWPNSLVFWYAMMYLWFCKLPHSLSTVRIQLKSWTITKNQGVWVTFPWENVWPSWSGVCFDRITNFGFLGAFNLIWLVFFYPRTFGNDSNLTEFYEHIISFNRDQLPATMCFHVHFLMLEKQTGTFFQPSNQQF